MFVCDAKNWFSYILFGLSNCDADCNDGHFSLVQLSVKCFPLTGNFRRGTVACFRRQQVSTFTSEFSANNLNKKINNTNEYGVLSIRGMAFPWKEPRRSTYNRQQLHGGLKINADTKAFRLSGVIIDFLLADVIWGVWMLTHARLSAVSCLESSTMNRSPVQSSYYALSRSSFKPLPFFLVFKNLFLFF